MSQKHYGDFDHYWFKHQPNADRFIYKRLKSWKSNEVDGPVTLSTSTGTYPYVQGPVGQGTINDNLQGTAQSVAVLGGAVDDDDDVAAGNGFPPPSNLAVAINTPTGSPAEQQSVTSYSSQTLATTNKLALQAIVGQEYTFGFFLPNPTSYYTYSSVTASTTFDPLDFNVTQDNFDGDNTAVIFTPLLPAKTLTHTYEYTITNTINGSTTLAFLEVCYMSTEGNRLPDDPCIDNNIDKTGEVTNIAVGTSTGSRPLFLPWNQSNVSQPQLSQVQQANGSFDLIIQRNNTGNALPVYIPVFFNDAGTPIELTFGTVYEDDQGNGLSGSPQFTTWTHCPSGGSGSYQFLINNSNYTRTISDTDPDFVNLRGLHYIRVNTVIPTKGTGTPYRQVRLTNIKSTLPAGWGLAYSAASSWTITSGPTPSFSGGEWLVGNAPAGTEWDVEITLSNQVPFDYGRSATLLAKSTSADYTDTPFTINDTDETGMTGWRTINLSPTPSGNLDMIWLNRPAYDVVSQTIKFKVRSNNGNERINGLYYLSTTP